MRQRRQVVGVMIHIMATTGLAGASVSPPVVCNHAIAMLRKNSICVSQSSAESGQPWQKTIGCPVPSPCNISAFHLSL